MFVLDFKNSVLLVSFQTRHRLTIDRQRETHTTHTQTNRHTDTHTQKAHEHNPIMHTPPPSSFRGGENGIKTLKTFFKDFWYAWFSIALTFARYGFFQDFYITLFFYTNFLRFSMTEARLSQKSCKDCNPLYEQSLGTKTAKNSG